MKISLKKGQYRLLWRKIILGNGQFINQYGRNTMNTPKWKVNVKLIISYCGCMHNRILKSLYHISKKKKILISDEFRRSTKEGQGEVNYPKEGRSTPYLKHDEMF